MAFDDLRQWIAALDRAGELKKIKTEVDPILEITEIADRVSKGAAKKYGRPGGPALLFENVKGASGVPVLINQFGSERRMQMALGVDRLDEIAERIRQLLNMKSPEGFLEKLKMLPMLADMGKFFPKVVPTGPCKEVIKKENFSLLDFPVLQCWPQDGGRFVTLPCVITRDPKTGKRNMGMYRIQIYDATTAGMHWQRQKVAAEHYRDLLRQGSEAQASDAKQKTRGAQAPGSPARAGVVRAGVEVPSPAERRLGVDIMARSGGGSMLAPGDRPSGTMEVAVAIGTEPALTFSAIVPAPPEIEEFIIAGFLRQKPVELVKCETVDLEVP
ncbi:MAG: UbiD family decarboxylase domain-containing protein, partial [Candidatus Angelobacter sp.]